MFPMTPLQSWATMTMHFALVCMLVWLLATVDAALDRRLVAKNSSRGVPSGRAAQLPDSPSTPPAPGAIQANTHDGFQIPARGDIYDYTVHGL